MSDIVGIAGCGRMGAPMLASLRRAGIAARGFDVRDGRGDGGPLADFTDGLTTLISVVRDTAETDALLFDDQALCDVPTLRTIIISSTLSPLYTKALRDRVPDHIALIDAPMSGAQVKAQAGTLSFMLGGNADDLAAQAHLFRAMGEDLHTMGAFGAGMTAKVLNNLLAASHTVMTRMVLDWADAAGIDESKLLALIAASSGQNWLASGFDTIEFARDGYADDNSIGILVKDVAAGLDMAPEGADTAIPDQIKSALRHLKPRA
ncbi:NAD(P)-dependent oxidoreductase [Yoonia sp. 208BN28-4]|uniref:NAD(P)-dependent oxidoreductase n=1 Tax=Yoonia sp. 208BN28-4 TaxID=3126505 RepID=UPI0030A72CBF